MRVIIITLIIVVADQLTKLLVKGFSIPFLNIYHQGMHHGERVSIIGDFFRLTYIENPGMAFGIDPGSSFKIWISLFSLLASIGLIVYLYFVKNESLSLRVALAFILGGAIGNLIDRMFYGVIFDYAPLFYGRVVDFLDFDFFNFTILGRSYDRWPIFNLADSAVSIGVLILLLFYRKHTKKEDTPKEVTSTSAEFNTNADNRPDEIIVPNNGETDQIREADKNNIQDDKSDKGKEASL
jgi:signal peptidase II